MPPHRNALFPAAAIAFISLAVAATGYAAENSTSPLDYTVETTVAREGFDGTMCWVHARAGAIPPGSGGNPAKLPLVVMTTQKLLLTGSDVFYQLNTLRSADMGKTWTAPQPEPVFKRRTKGENIVMTVCDFTPGWHAASGTLLGTGHTVWYKNNRVMRVRPRHTAYSVYDVKNQAWKPYKLLEMPRRQEFENAGAGSTQRVDLANGDILLPIYFKDPKQRNGISTVVRCTFDGKTLRYVEHGDELTIPEPRGFGEPSIAKYGGRFFLTLRNDKHGWVAAGTDGLHFDKPIEWRFDDGELLGNYNTQQHWVTHRDRLFLVYTRRGANNDRVFRHRAPLFMGRVDPDRLCVIRSSERKLTPERGARLGNFGVCEVSPKETWVIAAEWMQPKGCEKHGSNNAIYVVKIKWNRENGD